MFICESITLTTVCYINILEILSGMMDSWHKIITPLIMTYLVAYEHYSLKN